MRSAEVELNGGRVLSVEGRACAVMTDSAAATVALGARLGARLQAGDVVALVGDLGAGKTTFVQGIGQGLGIQGPITSPTFTLVGEYDGRLHLYHIDVYRLGDAAAEALAFGLDDLLGDDGVTVIEWAVQVRDLLPAACLWVTLETTAETQRRIGFETADPRLASYLPHLCDEA